MGCSDARADRAGHRVTLLRERAEAKINLSLEVIGRRADGYHDIVTIFQTIDLADAIEAEAAEGVSLTVDEPELDTPTNLATRAATALRKSASIAAGVGLTLTKRIPTAAGLGGGSADAAATLRVCARLWEVPLSQVRSVARELGADVSFLIDGGTALGEGRGERLTPLATPSAYAVIASPAIRIDSKTARAYGSLQAADFSPGEQTRSLARALDAGDLAALAEAPNAFRRVASEIFPGLDDLERAFAVRGAPWTRLSGSGPSLFTVIADPDRAADIGRRLTGRVRNVTIFVTPVTDRGLGRRVRFGSGRST